MGEREREERGRERWGERERGEREREERGRERETERAKKKREWERGKRQQGSNESACCMAGNRF